ncbi:hypothetical protein [Microbacterium sp. 2FI]|uniref:hypothetical protein n=1 Tax=Microbacterium sp. 2FI TaxID=2502193 RepID=UPI0010F6BA15|nr:hypothetical protein [Microbacterium sp. 2FI]
MNVQVERRSDEGIGLIELIVTMIIGGIITIAIVSVFINSLRTQEDVLSVNEATNRGQVVSSTIERAMRNALFFEVSDGGTILRVSTSLQGALKCQGFRLTEGSAQMTTSAVSLGSTPASWPVWKTGLAQQVSTPFFFDDPLTDGVVTFTFDVLTESAPVTFAGEAAMRSTPEGDSDSCWT